MHGIRNLNNFERHPSPRPFSFLGHFAYNVNESFKNTYWGPLVTQAAIFEI